MQLESEVVNSNHNNVFKVRLRHRTKYFTGNGRCIADFTQTCQGKKWVIYPNSSCMWCVQSIQTSASVDIAIMLMGWLVSFMLSQSVYAYTLNTHTHTRMYRVFIWVSGHIIHFSKHTQTFTVWLHQMMLYGSVFITSAYFCASLYLIC